jgi:hypothetical protein
MPMATLRGANLALRFVLELCMLAALAYWGFSTKDSTLVHVLLGVGVPLLAAIIWGIFLSPRAFVQLPEPLKLALEILVFAVATVALYSTGRIAEALALAVLYLVNRILLYATHA